MWITLNTTVVSSGNIVRRSNDRIHAVHDLQRSPGFNRLCRDQRIAIAHRRDRPSPGLAQACTSRAAAPVLTMQTARHTLRTEFPQVQLTTPARNHLFNKTNDRNMHSSFIHFQTFLFEGLC